MAVSDRAAGGSEAGSAAKRRGEVPVTIRSVSTDTHIYFLAKWEDDTESVSHKTWVWNPDKKTYDQGDDREDMFALGFEHEGLFTADMFSGDEAVWDVWHWKAPRSNPAGYAMDKTHHYTSAKPDGKAKSYEAKNGKTIWIASRLIPESQPRKSNRLRRRIRATVSPNTLRRSPPAA